MLYAWDVLLNYGIFLFEVGVSRDLLITDLIKSSR